MFRSTTREPHTIISSFQRYFSLSWPHRVSKNSTRTASTMNVTEREPLILSIDVGTTSVRTMLFRKSSEVLKKTQINYNSGTQPEGISELCGSKDINNNLITCLNDLFSSIDRNKFRVVSIGIANMRESIITWNAATLEPLSKSILWNDTRNKDLVCDLKRKLSSDQLRYFRKHTGLNNLSTYFSAGKLKWMLENGMRCADSSAKINVGTLDAWILSNFTTERVFKTDLSNACRTGVFNLDTLQNDPELFKVWDLDSHALVRNRTIQFPEIVSSSEFYGTFSLPPNFKDELVKRNIMSWLQGVPIQGCLGDQSASLVGHLKFEEAEIKMTYGTGCFLLLNAGTKRPVAVNDENRLLTTIGYKFPHLDDGKLVYAVEGTIGQAGFLVTWLLNNIKLIEDLDHLTAILREYNLKMSTNNVVFVPALTGLYAPYWDDNSRGAIFGIDANTRQQDLVVACIKGLALQVARILKEMKKYTKRDKMTISIDGGLSQNGEFLKLQAGLLPEKDCTLVRNINHEATSFGCAIAAAFAYKNPQNRAMWRDVDDLKESVRNYHQFLNQGNSNVFACNSDSEYLAGEYRKWDAAVKRNSSWLLEESPIPSAFKSKL